MEKKIDALFKLWTDNQPGPGGQIVVTHKGKIVFEKCYGYANLETMTPITQDSVFHVASITKMFTAMSVLILHERGQLDIYDDVRKYIPDLVGFSQPLTIKQMLNHVSGMREYYELLYLHGITGEDYLRQNEIRTMVSRQKELNFEPGQEFMYSNANYLLLTTIVERISGMTMNQFVTKNIFEPLGMEHSFIRDDPHAIIPNKVNSYVDDGYSFYNSLLNFGIYGSTSLNTTCRDLVKFLPQYKNPTLISRQTLENILLVVPEVEKGKTIYACGVRVQEMFGHKYYHHGGVNAGFRTWGTIFPDDDLVISIFTNTPMIPIEIAGRDIARIFLDLPERKIPTLDEYKTEAVDESQIPGLYYCRKNGDNFTINMVDGQLCHNKTPLEHVEGNLYKQGRKMLSFAFGNPTYVLENYTVTEMEKLEQTVPQELAEACVGQYYADEVHGHFGIVYEKGELWLDHIRLGKQLLHWLEGDTFFYGMKKITFTRDEAGQINGYLYKANQVRGLPFVKVK